MKTYTATELQKVLADHNAWLTDNSKGARADLRGADLLGANLSHVNLSGVNLRGADLSHVNLSGVNLRGADLSHVNLRCADLRGADLSHVNLRCADLSGANLSHAILLGAKFLVDSQELTVSKQSDFTRLIGSRHDGYRVKGFIKIGCEEHAVEYWLENVYQIAKHAGYREEQAEEYEDLIAFAALRGRY
jgi:hypothetical protein